MKLQKETRSHGRWYDDACGTAFALELIGERWSLLIVRELLLGGRRFSDLRASLPGISAKVLTERLESLARAGIVQRRSLPPPASAQLYELTAWGYEAEEPIKELGRWAAKSPDHDPSLPLSAVSLIISFRTMFDAHRARGFHLSGCLRVGDEEFLVEVHDGKLRAERGTPEVEQFRIAAPAASPIAVAVYGKVPLSDLAASGLSVSGDAALARRFVSLFHLPEKAS